jgi:magnesium-transporting ATPase (P-type)
MVTGDNLETAMAIAEKAGIISSRSDSFKSKVSSSKLRCMTGAEFRKKVGGLKEEIIAGEKKEVIIHKEAFW